MRPADVIETAECWQIAIEAKGKPTVLALTRQNLPTLQRCRRRKSLPQGRLHPRGRCIGDGAPDRVGLRSPCSPLEARDMLAKDGIAGRGRVHALAGNCSRRRTRAIKAQVHGPRGHGHAWPARPPTRFRLGTLARHQGRVHRHEGLRRFGQDRPTCTSISESRPRRSRNAARRARRSNGGE